MTRPHLWWDATWNPWTGCTPVSEGCDNCWARAMAKHFGKWPADRLVYHPEVLDKPLHWRKPRYVFVCNTSDVCLADVKDEWIAAAKEVMCRADHHTYLLLTKRPERYGQWGHAFDTVDWVWQGISAENQERLDEQMPHLLRENATVRWINFGPLLGPINVNPYLVCQGQQNHIETGEARTICLLCGKAIHCGAPSLSESTQPGPCGCKPIHWIALECESGPRRRPCKLEWVKSLIDQCDAAGVPVWVKQIPMPRKSKVNVHGAPQWPDLSASYLDMLCETHGSYVCHNLDDMPAWARRRERP